MAKILIVDDSVSLTLQVEEILIAGGHQVLSAFDGIEALKLVREYQDINLILLDYNMPKMDGLTLCAQVREIPAYANTPVLMLTTASNRKLIEQGRKLGIKAWMIKPIPGDRLLDIVGQLAKA